MLSTLPTTLLGAQGSRIKSDYFYGAGIGHHLPVQLRSVSGRCHNNNNHGTVKLFNRSADFTLCDQFGRFTYRKQEGTIWKDVEYIWYAELSPGGLSELFTWFHTTWPGNTTSDWLTYVNNDAVARNILQNTKVVEDLSSQYTQHLGAGEVRCRLLCALSNAEKHWDEWIEIKRATERGWLHGVASTLTTLKAWMTNQECLDFYKRLDSLP